jgi:hypothetical protein
VLFFLRKEKIFFFALEMLRGLTFVGLAILFHAGYSAIEFYSLAKSMGRDEDQLLPWDITLEAITSLICCVIGLALGSESFQPISTEEKMARSSTASLQTRPSMKLIHQRRLYLKE